MSKQQKSPATIARAADLEATLGTGKFNAAYKKVSGISAARAAEESHETWPETAKTRR